MFYRDNAALLYLFSHVSSCFHDRTSDNPHMLHSNKTSQFLLLASLPWQPDSFLEPTFLLAYIPQSRGRRPGFQALEKQGQDLLEDIKKLQVEAAEKKAMIERSQEALVY